MALYLSRCIRTSTDKRKINTLFDVYLVRIQIIDSYAEFVVFWFDA